MTTKTKGASARLAELRAAVEQAEARVREVEAERRRTMAELARAEAPLRDYWEEVGAGERDPDPGLERKLAAAVRDARATAVTVPIRSSTDPNRIIAVETHDQAIEAKLAGARRALEERRRELREYLSGNGELVAEWIAEAAEVRAACEERWAPLAEALRDWQRLAVRWGPFLEANGIDRGEIPAHPLAGLERDPARHGFALPAPESLLPDPEPEA